MFFSPPTHTQKKGGKKGGQGKTKSKNIVSMEGGAGLIVEERMYMM